MIIAHDFWTMAHTGSAKIKFGLKFGTFSEIQHVMQFGRWDHTSQLQLFADAENLKKKIIKISQKSSWFLKLTQISQQKLKI